MTDSLMKSAEEYAQLMIKNLADSTIEASLQLLDEHTGDKASRELTFQSGYGAGAADAFMNLVPRGMQMGKIIKTLYTLLDAIAIKHDDIEFLTDIAEMHGVIAAFLVEESETIIRSSSQQLSKMSGVPEKYLDNSILISDIPPDELREIGRTVAEVDKQKFAIFSVTDGKEMTLEELQQAVNDGTITAAMPPDNQMVPLLIRYGSMQVRRTRVVMDKLIDSLDSYKKNHEKHADVLATDLISRAKAGT
jgi:hypothetical protein